VNSSLVSERETRGQARAFVSYVDLLSDWRPVLTGLADDLGLTYDVDVAGGEASGVDEFIDPDLRRHQVTWDELEVPESLQSIAQSVWDALLVLQAGHGVDDAASAELDDLSERYRELFRTAADISHDAVETERRRLRELTEKSRRPDGKRSPKAPAAETRTRHQGVDAVPVGDVGGRDLLRVVARRLRRKVTRR
jgi:hypothetical protein